MSNHQNSNKIYNEQQIDIPLFKTEQGQYLATNLGDPLIRALTEIANKKPKDPIEYLINFLQNYVKLRDGNGVKVQDFGQNGQLNVHKVNGVLNQPNVDESNSSAKSDPLQIESTLISRQLSESKVNNENDGTDDDSNLSDSNLLVEERDEHGQSMLHFACARSHGRNALISLIDESNIDITYRDELYRTARDVSLQANQPGNAKEIDRYVLSLATTGDDKIFQHMLMNGYDHILDVEDDDGNTIFDVCRSRNNSDIIRFLEKVRSFEETREQIHAAIRLGQLDVIEDLVASAVDSQIIKAKNYYGRTALHIAILKENEDIVEYIVNKFTETIKIGDNLERMPLHYAMGVGKVEKISRILINKGAKRTAKDLKGRQPSYYFINKSDILRLQEEEIEDH